MEAKEVTAKATASDVYRVIKVILSDRKSYSTSLNYAIAYCQLAQGMAGEELRVQCLYILNNISHWRHPQAKEVREVLKSFSKTTYAFR
jgi:hypothetical protein